MDINELHAKIVWELRTNSPVGLTALARKFNLSRFGGVRNMLRGMEASGEISIVGAGTRKPMPMHSPRSW